MWGEGVGMSTCVSGHVRVWVYEGVRLPSCDQCSPAGPHSAAAAPAPSSYSRTRTASPPTPETGGREEGSHHPQDIAHPPDTHPHHGFLTTPPPPHTHTHTIQLYTSTPRDRKLEISLLLSLPLPLSPVLPLPSAPPPYPTCSSLLCSYCL